jgi:hypothetical protein
MTFWPKRRDTAAPQLGQVSTVAHSARLYVVTSHRGQIT